MPVTGAQWKDVDVPAASKYRELWTVEEEMVRYPRDMLVGLGAKAEGLPDGDEIPADVGIVFTASLTEDIGLYQRVRLVDLNGRRRTLVIVGAVETNHSLLYALCADTWNVVQFDLEEQDIQHVNADLRRFVDFLFHFGLFIEDDDGPASRPARVVELRARLAEIDPTAFAEDSWWSLTFAVMTD